MATPGSNLAAAAASAAFVVADENGTVSIEIKDESSSSSGCSNEWLSSIMNVGDDSRGISPQKPKIQKVQPMLREVESNKKCYNPNVVSIGPCHHGKPELDAVERLKIQLAREYLKNSEATTIHQLYGEVFKLAGDARKCYAEGLTERFNDEEFARMMFLDGCFILQYIYSIVKEINTILMAIPHAALVRRDLFLLENQLPFRVLKALMRSRFGNGEGEKMISDFIKRITEDQSSSEGVPLNERIKKSFGENFWKRQSQSNKEQERKYEDEPIHLLELVWRQFIYPKPFTIGCYLTSGWYSRRSAKDFKAVGIHFRRSRTYQFTDIEFESIITSGILTLPPIIIDDTTKSMLLNLAAFEACPDNAANDFEVTSYICFMDSLIDHAEDVKVLRSKGILLNFLGSDQQVADLFNEIATELVPSPHAYVEVKSRIEQHHRNRIKVWIAESRHTYFRSPWTVIAVTAAILAITLSVVQTVLGAFQTYLAAYPPKD